MSAKIKIYPEFHSASGGKSTRVPDACIKCHNRTTHCEHYRCSYYNALKKYLKMAYRQSKYDSTVPRSLRDEYVKMCQFETRLTKINQPKYEPTNIGEMQQDRERELNPF
jgi:transcriptional regulator NrdR family protein